MREKRERVRTLLAKHSLNYAWLLGELEKRGLSVWSSQLSEILSGKRRGEKSDAVVEASAEILDRYEKNFAEK